MAKELQKPSCETKDKYTEDDYINMLRDCYGDVNVCGMAMDAANILKDSDPTAFRVGFNEWNESIDVYTCPICGTEFENDEDGALHCCQTEDEEETEE
jgi:hypothetical protein